MDLIVTKTRVLILDLEIQRLVEPQAFRETCISCNFFMSHFLPSLVWLDWINLSSQKWDCYSTRVSWMLGSCEILVLATSTPDREVEIFWEPFFFFIDIDWETIYTFFDIFTKVSLICFILIFMLVTLKKKKIVMYEYYND